MFMRTNRLFLRPGWPEDWSAILLQVADEAVVRNLSQVPWPYTGSDARMFAGQPQEPRHPHFLVTRPSAEGVDLIGCIGLKPGGIDGEGEAAELGYWIGRAHWGQGYATEAARAVLSLARTIGHNRLIARHFFDNPASGRVLRKVGFSFTGKISEAYSHARGEMAPSLVHAIELGEPSDCDGGNDPDMAAKRAA